MSTSVPATTAVVTAKPATTTDNEKKTNAAAAPDLSARGLGSSDAQLKDNKEWQALFVKYHAPASEAAVTATAKAINGKGASWKAHIVSDAKAAVDLVASLVPQKASVGFGYSTTFNEIGLNDYFKDRSDLHNYRAIALAAQEKGDMATAIAARMQGLGADYFLTSVDAVTADGELVLADASGTRAPGPMTGKNVIIVVGANKLVPTYADAIHRLEKYVLPQESARMRLAYKMPGSAINNMTVLRGASPFAAPGRLQVIIIAGHSYGS